MDTKTLLLFVASLWLLGSSLVSFFTSYGSDPSPQTKREISITIKPVDIPIDYLPNDIKKLYDAVSIKDVYQKWNGVAGQQMTSSSVPESSNTSSGNTIDTIGTSSSGNTTSISGSTSFPITSEISQSWTIDTGSGTPIVQ